MASTSWMRKRERHHPSADGEARESEDGRQAEPSRLIDDPDLGQISSMAGADEYSAWAERLRQKRVDTKRQHSEATGVRSAPDPVADAWQSDDLFGDLDDLFGDLDGQTFAELQSQHDPVAISAALAVLGLEQGAALADVDASYRKAAKLHHPDRFVNEPDAIRLAHADRFRSLSTARDLLREADRARLL